MRRLWIVLVAALCIASPGFALDRTITSGIDLWQTPGDGSTFVDFAKNPLPAGFFCFKSAPFRGRVVMKGAPVVTGVAGELGKADTIVHRLDDAVFNARGLAITRVQVRALEFESVQPVQTACGAFNAYVKLDGVQPITRMLIRRENENGGRISAPIWLNIKVGFTPVGQASSELLEIPIRVRFPPLPNLPWTGKDLVGAKQQAFVRVDTDNDRVADTYLPGTSNIVPGLRSRPAPHVDKGSGLIAVTEAVATEVICHDETEATHCFIADQ